MDIFVKAVAGALLAAVFCIILSKNGKEQSLLLSTAACCVILLSARFLLRPIVAFIEKLQDLGNLNPMMVSVMLKAVGIGLLAQITELICKDGGNSALGKTISILSGICILFLSVPVLEELLALMDSVLGEL